LNVLGNIPLWLEYDRTKYRHAHVAPWKRKGMNGIMQLLIFWTYPQSVELKYRRPPSFRLYTRLRNKYFPRNRPRGGAAGG